MSTNDEWAARVASIRARLAAATPGPWQTWPDGTEESVESVSVGRFVCHLNSNMRQFREDAALIANAPDDIAWLLAELEAATARAERYRVALYGPVPEGSSMPTLSGYECRLCCADAKPSEPDMHEDDCPVRRAALAEGA